MHEDNRIAISQREHYIKVYRMLFFIYPHVD